MRKEYKVVVNISKLGLSLKAVAKQGWDLYTEGNRNYISYGDIMEYIEKNSEVGNIKHTRSLP